jgi:NTP pyrophosphatase (non-canonical NTP hydrolase)
MDEFRDALSGSRKPHTRLVLGAGVTIAATGDAPTASWRGLLQHGLERVQAVNSCPASRVRVLGTILAADDDPAAYVYAAELITESLGGRGGPEFATWLEDAIGGLEITDSSLVDALVGLDVPILTTNYDGLLEAATGLAPVTWLDGSHLQSVIRGTKPAVVHLHGYYERPESVVLGIRSYEDALHTEQLQALQQAMATLQTLVFVGVGDGLDDPNFSALRAWIRKTQPAARHRHFRLCTNAEYADLRAGYDGRDHIRLIAYGDGVGDLPAFLREHTRPARPAKKTRDGPPATEPVDVLPFRLASGRELTKQTSSSATIDEWQGAFWSLYEEQDRALPLFDMMLQMIVDATRLSEAMRKGKYEEAFACLPRVFSWMCSMSAKCASDPELADLSKNGGTLGDIIWNKYPGLCSLCAEEVCVCPMWNADVLELERTSIEAGRASKLDTARAVGTRPERLDDWVAMFDKIYGNVNATRDSSSKVLHLWEEIGELEVELRKADRLKSKQVPAAEKKHLGTVEWESELADVFSWLSSVYLHIDGSLKSSRRVLREFATKASRIDRGQKAGTEPHFLPLSQWMWLEYGDDRGKAGLRCHRCHEQPQCRCVVFVDRR